jgi:hypothetical protein
LTSRLITSTISFSSDNATTSPTKSAKEQIKRWYAVHKHHVALVQCLQQSKHNFDMGQLVTSPQSIDEDHLSRLVSPPTPFTEFVFTPTSEHEEGYFVLVIELNMLAGKFLSPVILSMECAPISFLHYILLKIETSNT